MEIKHTHFYDHIFFYIIVPLIIMVGFASYYRFIVKHDYVVKYEGVCDPATEKCFIGCEDDGCTQEYYYSKVVKYSPDLYRECGKDITDCEAASICLPSDSKCSVTYCDIDLDGDACKTFTEEPDEKSDDQVESIKDENLQSNNIINTHI